MPGGIVCSFTLMTKWACAYIPYAYAIHALRMYIRCGQFGTLYTLYQALANTGNSRMVSVGLIALVFVCSTQGLIEDEAKAWEWFHEFGEQASLISNRGSKVSWAYATNITDYNQQQEVRYVHS